MTNNTINLNIGHNDLCNFNRLDHFLVHKTEEIGLGRTGIRKLWQAGLILMSPNSNGATKIKTLGKMPAIGTEIILKLPVKQNSQMNAQKIFLDVLHEDEHLLFINKPQGMVVHPAPGNPDGTLVNALLYHYPDLEASIDVNRPGIVHRLDKGTSGVMVVAKTIDCLRKMVDLFSNHEIDRQYVAITKGDPGFQEGVLESNIGRHPINRKKMAVVKTAGKYAKTYYKKIGERDNLGLVELTLHTGRTHQIRVHLSQLLKSPVLNDEVYGRKANLKCPDKVNKVISDSEHPFLHAKNLGFKHPITGEKLFIESAPPLNFQKLEGYILNLIV